MAKSTPRPPADGERVAVILAEAKLLGDKEAAQKHGVSERTIRRWRVSAMASRPDVAEAVAANVRQAKDSAISEIGSDIKQAMSEAIGYVRWSAESRNDPKAKPNAMMAQAMVTAIRVFAEVTQTGNDDAKARQVTLTIRKASGPSKVDPE